jgi:hypothetical protein
MDNTLKQDLKKQFDALPPEVQAAISDADLPKKLQDIVKNNKLMIDQAGGLQNETILVLFGLEPLENYVKNLQTNVGLSSIQASVIAHDVNESIFKTIRESLKKVNEQTSEIEKTIGEKPPEIPTKENIIAGIENPENIKNTEESISISSLQSNTATKPEIYPEMAKEGIEIRVGNLPEIAPEAKLPIISSIPSIPRPAIAPTSSVPKQAEPLHLNIPPVSNIVEAKLTSTVAVPKENIVVEEKTKLPEKPKTSGDLYREAAM